VRKLRHYNRHNVPKLTPEEERQAARTALDRLVVKDNQPAPNYATKVVGKGMNGMGAVNVICCFFDTGDLSNMALRLEATLDFDWTSQDLYDRVLHDLLRKKTCDFLHPVCVTGADGTCPPCLEAGALHLLILNPLFTAPGTYLGPSSA